MSEQTVTSAAAERGPLAMEAISVSKDFRLAHGQKLHAVRDVSFNLYRGAAVALVGESGSGKSTAARLLAGQERLTSGMIRLDGQPVEVSSRHAFRRYKSQVQYVFQDPFASLNPVHTVRYHLERPVQLHQPAADVNTEVVTLLEQVRLTPAKQFLAKYPHELSGGQRQRVSFARALAARPSVLLADEPVSMLDVSIRLEMLSLLDDLRRRLSLALLYITHDIASARYFADEILVMYAGEIVERGPAEELTQRPAHPYTQLLVITQAFNPYVTTQAAYGMGADGLIYEPLIQFDVAAPPKYYPWLATSYAWSNGGKTIAFTIRSGVKWSNGTPFTPADVAFTFNMLKGNAAINLDGLKISTVSTSGNTVTLTFPTAQYANLQNIAGTAIVPQAIWSKVGNPATYTDPNPVGTGPYVLDSFTPQGFTLKENPSYWQAADIKVPKVYFPVYTSNTGALTALFSGAIDWTGNFIPGLQKDFVDTNPSEHGYWEAPGGTNSLMPNLNKWPTNQLTVRQAISAAINRSLIATEGEAGLEDPVLNATGLTLPTYNAWSGPVASMTVSATGSSAAAEAILTKAGYTKGSDGFFAKGGKTVALTIVDPAAYTDYAEDDALVAGELRAAGIDATFDGIAVTTWDSDVADGDFQLTSHWSNSGLTPYNMYDGWLDSSLATGSAATGDYERLNDPAINADLAALAAAPTTAAQTTALAPLATYVADNLPIIPTTTASDWFEYNSQNYTGWPTQANPYESGQPSGSNNGGSSGTDEVVILHLTPRT